jgi:polar amino acid transport system substrate-binding protein
VRFAYLIEPPFNYRNEAGDVTGCDVELARVILAMIGIHDIEFIEAEFSQLLPGLNENLWDMTTGLFNTAERRRIVAFSHPIWALPDGLLVMKGNPRNLDGYASATRDPECTLVAIRDQIQHRVIMEAAMPDDRILICETYDDAAQAVVDGRADAYASVAMAHLGFLQQNPQLDLEIVAVSPEERPAASGAFAFRQSDRKLQSAVDAALRRYIGSDEHHALMRNFGFDDQAIANGKADRAS